MVHVHVWTRLDHLRLICTREVAVDAGLVVLVALTVTSVSLFAPGALYNPLIEIDPHEADHVTSWFAVNWTDPFGVIVALVGEISTGSDGGGGGGGGDGPKCIAIAANSGVWPNCVIVTPFAVSL